MPFLHDSIKKEPHMCLNSTVAQGWTPGKLHHRNESADQENPADLCSLEPLIEANPCWNGSPLLSNPQSSRPGEQESIMEPEDPEPLKDSRSAQNHITQEKGSPLPPLINSSVQEESFPTDILTFQNNLRPSRSPPPHQPASVHPSTTRIASSNS